MRSAFANNSIAITLKEILLLLSESIVKCVNGANSSNWKSLNFAKLMISLESENNFYMNMNFRWEKKDWDEDLWESFENLNFLCEKNDLTESNDLSK